MIKIRTAISSPWVAYHEAGHAVAFIRQGYRGVEIGYDKRCKAFYTSAVIPSPPGPEEDALIYLAGPIAEAVSQDADPREYVRAIIDEYTLATRIDDLVQAMRLLNTDVDGLTTNDVFMRACVFVYDYWRAIETVARRLQRKGKRGIK